MQTLQQNQFRNIRLIVVAIPVILHILMCLFERMPVNFGLGWDGSGYYNFVNWILDGEVKEKVSNYYIQRISSSALVAGVSSLAGIRPTPEQVILGYTLINLISILVAMKLYFNVSRIMQYGPMTELFGFIGIFYSFFILKISAYYPMLVDVPAFALGFGLLYAWLSRKFWLTCIVLLLGAFTFPTILVMGILLMVLEPPVENETTRKRFRINIASILIPYRKPLLLLAPVAVMAGYAAYGFLIFRYRPDYIAEFSDGKPVVVREILLAAILSAIMLFMVIRELTNSFISAPSIVVNLRNLLLLAGMYVVIKMVQTELSNPKLSLDWKWFTVNLFKQSVQFPAGTIASHIMYYGPILALGIFYFRRMMRTVTGYGMGLLIFFSVNLLMMVAGNESRQFVVFLPFLVMFLLLSISKGLEKNLNLSKLMIHGVAALLASRIWFRINVDGFADKAQNLVVTNEYSDPLIQRYFISQGPWMTMQSYLIILTSALLLSVMYYYMFRDVRKPVHESPGS